MSSASISSSRDSIPWWPHGRASDSSHTQATLSRIHPPVILSWPETYGTCGTCGEPLGHAWSPWSSHCSSKYREMELLCDSILGGIGGRSIPAWLAARLLFYVICVFYHALLYYLRPLYPPRNPPFRRRMEVSCVSQKIIWCWNIFLCLQCKFVWEWQAVVILAI